VLVVTSFRAWVGHGARDRSASATEGGKERSEMGLAERRMAMVLMMGEDERVLEVDDDGGVSGVAVEDVAGRNALRASGGNEGIRARD
jgi:hypothetical protein